MAHPVTLKILRHAATHDLSYDPMKSARRNRRGDIINAFSTLDKAAWDGEKYVMFRGNGNLKIVHIHIIDVPNNINIEMIRNRLLSPIIATIPEDPPRYVNTRLCKFRVRPSQIPPAVLAILDADREYTVTWTQAKNFIKRKQIVTLLDPTQDDESAVLTDADITG